MQDDPEGFQAFYLEHRATAFRTAYLMTGDTEEARDLTQEAFARAYQRWSHVSAHEKPGAWLQTVVSRLAISWLRRKATRTRFQHVLGGRDVAEIPDAGEPSVLRALDALTPAQRRVVILRFYGDISVDEVARMTGRKSGTVKALTAQALARMRPILEESGVQP